jgi:hypothetical protein
MLSRLQCSAGCCTFARPSRPAAALAPRLGLVWPVVAFQRQTCRPPLPRVAELRSRHRGTRHADPKRQLCEVEVAGRVRPSHTAGRNLIDPTRRSSTMPRPHHCCSRDQDSAAASAQMRYGIRAVPERKSPRRYRCAGPNRARSMPTLYLHSAKMSLRGEAWRESPRWKSMA